ncbi:ATP-binding protein [Arsenicibacter rosenii]|uniref:histidine kinase n=1 Tax=Arsenicibacter rosenii TaxID=1750698 RepID=A0A1S2VPN7_9BACT|nr:histidine kinase [Arsenicibacter rosenii]OIN60737.1 histidine kinase [Arsenicibacter rosenii]
MQELDQLVARRLTRFYVMALTVIAVLTMSGLFFIKQTINDHNDDGRVLNVAGRQRMLSQRLTKLALLDLEQIPASDTVAFDSLLAVWSRVHMELKTGSLLMEQRFTVRKSPAIDSMFIRIEPAFQAIRAGFASFTNPQASDEIKRKALLVILQKEPAYLDQMNEIVFRFDVETFERVRYLEQVEWVLGIATLITVLIEGLFIFRPVVSHTQTIIRKLTESEDALRYSNHQLAVANNELADTNQQLIDTQAELIRTTEEKYELQRTEDRVRSAALLEGQEEERRRFARELHDGIGQMLTGLKLHAESLKRVQIDDDKLRKRFDELCELIQETIRTTRQVSYNLMPSVLGDFGLSAALQLLAEQTAHIAGRTITFEGSPVDRLPPAIEIGLYRIAQEALNNAIKYADAEHIFMKIVQEKTYLTLSVEDNGKGFVLKNVRKANPIVNGLENMKTRARLLNGEFVLTSKLKKGTKVYVKIAR